MVDLESLKGLLAEQAAQINESQRASLAEFVQGIRREMDDHRREVRHELEARDTKVQAIEDKVEGLAGKVDKLLQGGVERAGGVTHDEERHKYTLVYGGFPKDTPRAELLKKLEDAMGQLDLKSLLDSPAFTTGPRRSLALQTFHIRPNETFVGMRNRMSVIIAAISNASV